MPVAVEFVDVPATITGARTHTAPVTFASDLVHTTGKLGFYGASPIGARASASSHASSVVSASSYITVASNLAAFATDISATLVALGIWT